MPNAVISRTQPLFSRSACLMEFFGSFDLKPFWFSDQDISGRWNQIVSWISESHFAQQDSLLQMHVFAKAFNPAFLAPVETNLSKRQHPPPKPPILG